MAANSPGRAVLPLIASAAGIEGDDDALLFFRSQLVLASRLAELDAPADGVTTALGDDAAMALDGKLVDAPVLPCARRLLSRGGAPTSASS